MLYRYQFADRLRDAAAERPEMENTSWKLTLSITIPNGEMFLVEYLHRTNRQDMKEQAVHGNIHDRSEMSCGDGCKIFMSVILQ